jgi:hypothetical protein
MTVAMNFWRSNKEILNSEAADKYCELVEGDSLKYFFQFNGISPKSCVALSSRMNQVGCIEQNQHKIQS